MNAYQQISLKIRLGLDPDREISPARLRRLWQRRVDHRKPMDRPVYRRRDCAQPSD